MRRGAIVAIDGPAGAGKSTVARRLARRLGYTLVDTGALYRAVALAASERGISFDDDERLAELVRSIDLRLETGGDGSTRVILDGRDRSEDIRTPPMSMGASAVSARPVVRAGLLGLQRELGREGGVVLEGRDIGTVVFPEAEAKFFLTATPEERARRRVEELRGRGIPADMETTLTEVVTRDRQDANRPIAPLRKADDAIEVDSTGISIDDLVEGLAAVVLSRTGDG